MDSCVVFGLLFRALKMPSLGVYDSKRKSISVDTDFYKWCVLYGDEDEYWRCFEVNYNNRVFTHRQ